MADEWLRKSYSGASAGTTLSANISGSTMAIAVVSGAGFPDGAAGPFVICIERGLVEEKILVASRSGNTLTVQQRGYDGTPAAAHLAGVAMEHVLDAHSIDQANALSSVMDSVGSMAYRSSGNSYVKLPMGTSGLPIVAGATTPGYAELGVAGVSLALIEYLSPAGKIESTIKATADAGYLLIDGTTHVNASTLYPYLWAKLPTSWKSGATSMVLPDARGKQLFMDDTAGAFTLGLIGGANTVVVAQANLPAVNLSADPAAASVTVTVNDNTVDRATRLSAPAPNTYVALLDTSGDGAPDAVPGSSGMVMLHETEHTHTASGTVDLPAFNVALGGSGTALDNRSAYLAVNFQIKAH